MLGQNPAAVEPEILWRNSSWIDKGKKLTRLIQITNKQNLDRNHLSTAIALEVCAD